jgi:hypothetical protein
MSSIPWTANAFLHCPDDQETMSGTLEQCCKASIEAPVTRRRNSMIYCAEIIEICHRVLPPEIADGNLYLLISAYMRKIDPPGNGSIVLAADDKSGAKGEIC